MRVVATLGSIRSFRGIALPYHPAHSRGVNIYILRLTPSYPSKILRRALDRATARNQTAQRSGTPSLSGNPTALTNPLAMPTDSRLQKIRSNPARTATALPILQESNIFKISLDTLTPSGPGKSYGPHAEIKPLLMPQKFA